MNDFTLRILMMVPWILPIWIIIRAFNGEMDGLLAFVLVIILLPIVLIINAVTFALVKGQGVLKQVRNMQKAQTQAHKTTEKEEPVKVKNHAD